MFVDCRLAHPEVDVPPASGHPPQRMGSPHVEDAAASGGRDSSRTLKQYVGTAVVLFHVSLGRYS